MTKEGEPKQEVTKNTTTRRLTANMTTDTGTQEELTCTQDEEEGKQKQHKQLTTRS